MTEKLDTSISYWTGYMMYEGSEQELALPSCGLCLLLVGNRGKHGLLAHAYTTCDQADRTPKEVEVFCRKRSTIETSFRTR